MIDHSLCRLAAYFIVISVASLSLNACSLRIPYGDSLVEVRSATADRAGDVDAITAWASKTLRTRDFAALEKEIANARKNRIRLPGGYWKLNTIYTALETPNPDMNAAETEWAEHFERLTAWKQIYPNSIGPVIALARAWSAYAFVARGKDYAHKVSDESFRIFFERLDKADIELTAGRHLDEGDPEWYVAKLHVGFGKGGSKAEFFQIFEKGFQLEPTYFHIQREMVNYLRPQWYGKEGDVETFIRKNADRIGGEEGDIMYFLLTSTLLPTPLRNEVLLRFMKNRSEWRRAENGYRCMVRLYGTDNYRKNIYAFLATNGLDRESLDAAEAALNELGEHGDDRIWGSKAAFNAAKASLPARKQMLDDHGR